jgi:hypothetical protein
MGEGQKQKIGLKIILFAFLLSCMFMVVTTPIHEAAHWLMSDIDPYIDPVEIHLFNFESKNDNNILSSTLGYVVIKEKYPGAFNDRPYWMDLLQEFICIMLQIILSVLIVLIIFRKLIGRKIILTKISM